MSSVKVSNHSMYIYVHYYSKEVEYAVVVNIIGVLGDHISFLVSGSGSADEATLL